LSLKYSKVEEQIIHKAVDENKSDMFLNRDKLVQRLTVFETHLSPSMSDSFVISGKKRTQHKQRPGTKTGQNSRGSRFRGVSKNGSKFQVFIMINKKKRYFGVLENEEHSALVYDRLAIVFHGLKVGHPIG
jgi:hypothetical protein